MIVLGVPCSTTRSRSDCRAPGRRCPACAQAGTRWFCGGRRSDTGGRRVDRMSSGPLPRGQVLVPWSDESASRGTVPGQNLVGRAVLGSFGVAAASAVFCTLFCSLGAMAWAQPPAAPAAPAAGGACAQLQGLRRRKVLRPGRGVAPEQGSHLQRVRRIAGQFPGGKGLEGHLPLRLQDRKGRRGLRRGLRAGTKRSAGLPE